MSIVINLEKAREIKKDMVRAERAPMLAALDVDYQRALEAGDTVRQAEIVAKKQALRDATAHTSIVDASTVEELKAANPLA